MTRLVFAAFAAAIVCASPQASAGGTVVRLPLDPSALEPAACGSLAVDVEVRCIGPLLPHRGGPQRPASDSRPAMTDRMLPAALPLLLGGLAMLGAFGIRPRA